MSTAAGRAVRTAPTETGRGAERLSLESAEPAVRTATKFAEASVGTAANFAEPSTDASTESTLRAAEDPSESSEAPVERSPRSATRAARRARDSVSRVRGASSESNELTSERPTKSSPTTTEDPTESTEPEDELDLVSESDDAPAPTKSPRRRRRRRRKSAAGDASAPTNSEAAPPPAAEPRRKIVAVARDPEVAFVYWSCDDAADAKLIWRAGDRTVRVERVRSEDGKQYLPFVAPDVAHSATLEIGDVHVHSNTVRPPPSAPRAAGPGIFVRPEDPQRVVLAERQRRDRAHLPSHPARSPNNAPSSRRR